MILKLTFFASAEKGALFENMIVMEMVKRFSACKGKTDFFFYRTQAGLEVDLIIERNGKLYGMEVKLAKTITRKHGAGLVKFGREFKLEKSCVACLREEELPLKLEASFKDEIFLPQRPLMAYSAFHFPSRAACHKPQQLRL
ncbi:MAG: DUF4143 domain-containing protein [Nitrospirota bacterium]